MPRRLRHPKLETRTARLTLSVAREPYWVKIAPGAFLGYRRIDGENGSWWMRRLLPGTRQYVKQAFAKADDYAQTDEREILNYFAAVEAAKKHAKVTGPATIAELAERYVAQFVIDGKKSLADTKARINAFVLPTLGPMRLGDLTAARLEAWLRNIANQPPRRRTKVGAPQAFGEQPKTPDDLRRRRNSANRTWNMMHAMLEFAHTKGIVAHTEWRKVSRLRDADAPRIRYLDELAAQRLVVEASSLDAAFGDLVSAALLTGCRFGELSTLVPSDYADARLYIKPGKTGKGRYVTLSDEGAEFFAALAAAKTPNMPMLAKTNGAPWRKNDYQRLLRRASASANIAPPVEFHALRHSFASILLARGVRIELISKQLGHSNIHLTLRHYAHLADQQVRAIMNEKMPQIRVGTKERGVGTR